MLDVWGAVTEEASKAQSAVAAVQTAAGGRAVESACSSPWQIGSNYRRTVAAQVSECRKGARGTNLLGGGQVGDRLRWLRSVHLSLD